MLRVPLGYASTLIYAVISQEKHDDFGEYDNFYHYFLRMILNFFADIVL